jgi:hypothetical protein
MFGTLLGKASPEKPKEEVRESVVHDKVGWADNDIDLDLDL